MLYSIKMYGLYLNVVFISFEEVLFSLDYFKTTLQTDTGKLSVARHKKTETNQGQIRRIEERVSLKMRMKTRTEMRKH